MDCLRDENGKYIPFTFTITCINKVTGEKQTWPAKNRKDYLKTITEEDRLARRDGLGDPSLEYFATVTYGNNVSESSEPMLWEKDAEQLAAFQALKDLKLIRQSLEFDAKNAVGRATPAEINESELSKFCWLLSICCLVPRQLSC